MIPELASILLGAVMCFAGGAKIASGRRWVSDARAVGSPRWTTPFIPWVEIGTGALLIVQWQRRWTAVFAACLLCAFTILVVVNLARGNRPRCACFGTWNSRPLGAGHVVRNAALIACAVVAAL